VRILGLVYCGAQGKRTVMELFTVVLDLNRTQRPQSKSSKKKMEMEMNI
jgi:hypothetical protein